MSAHYVRRDCQNLPDVWTEHRGGWQWGEGEDYQEQGWRWQLVNQDKGKGKDKGYFADFVRDFGGYSDIDVVTSDEDSDVDEGKGKGKDKGKDKAEGKDEGKDKGEGKDKAKGKGERARARPKAMKTKAMKTKARPKAISFLLRCKSKHFGRGSPPSDSFKLIRQCLIGSH